MFRYRIGVVALSVALFSQVFCYEDAVSHDVLQKELKALQRSSYGSGLIRKTGYIRVTEENAPELNRMIEECARKLGIATPSISVFDGNFLSPLVGKSAGLLEGLCLAIWAAIVYESTQAVIEKTFPDHLQQNQYLTEVISILFAVVGMRSLSLLLSDQNDAYALSLTKNKGHVCVGSRLLEDLSPQEVEGVIAHEVANIVHNHFPKKYGLYLTFKTIKVFLFNDTGLMPCIMNVVRNIYSRECVREADKSAVGVLDDPSTLADALEKIEEHHNIYFLNRLLHKFMDISVIHYLCSERPRTSERTKYLREQSASA